MKVYKHDRYDGAILLAYPAFGDKILGVPFHKYYGAEEQWVRSGLGIAIPYYTQEKLDTMECLGETGKEWEFVEGKWFDASYLIDNRGKTNGK